MNMLRMEKKIKQQWMSLWFVTIWSLWLVRNNIIFENSSFQLDEVMNLIYLHSWNILCARYSDFNYSYMEWVLHPSSCFS
ncbi:hypothetical protein Lalb_Chr12g0206871 [Lupinus albus]|uniref:Uncharacterized protein n=1 Tax=Lupinus albus TaxID=3870 RepID=A0A6A4PPD1_LUPAL|nr:hypothetical protein Lalb_Chr12g0206871 [Lupinus albus]